MKSFQWTNAGSLEEAIGQLGRGVMVKAGGVDLLDRMKEGLEAPEKLVNLRTIPGLGSIPALNKIATTNSKTQEEDELLIVITPHVVRLEPGESAEVWLSK